MDPACAQRWTTQRPFPHLVVDRALSATALAELRQAVSAEPHWPNRDEIHEVMASANQTAHPRLEALRRELASEPWRAAIEQLIGRPVVECTLRSYVYLRGSYLLPHSDNGAGSRRAAAWVLYLSDASAFTGGELQLYDRGEPARTLAPKAGQLVIFSVSDASLHRVCEVTDGARISLTGWWLE